MNTKIKYKLSKQEIRSLIEILELIQEQGQYSGLAGKASMSLLKKPYMRLLSRWENLKKENNSLSLSWPEIWALRYQFDRINHLLGHYEHNVTLRLDLITNQKLIQ